MRVDRENDVSHDPRGGLILSAHWGVPAFLAATQPADELMARGSLWGALEHHRVPA